MNTTAIVERTTLRRDSAQRQLDHWGAIHMPTWAAVANTARYAAMVEAYDAVLADLTGDQS